MAKRFDRVFLLSLAAMLAVTAYWVLFTTLMGHDDEGYVLISLQNYSAHGGLYARVYSQYGPFLYLLHDFGHRVFGYAFTNTTGRLITLVCWMVAVTGSAHLVWRQTRDFTLTGFTLALTFFQLWLMSGEPIHPGGLIAALVAIAAAAGAALIRRGAATGLAMLIGLISAALLLTKVNIGIFFVAATGAWFGIQMSGPRSARWLTGGCAVVLLILPFGLMRSTWHEGWTHVFAELSVVASLTMMAATWRERRPMASWSHAGVAVLTGAGLAVTIIGLVCWRGTTLREMADGILLGPLRHPTVYHYPPFWRPGAEIVAGLSLGLALVAWKIGLTRLGGLVVCLRLALIALITAGSLEWVTFTSLSSIMSYVISCAWIFAVRVAPRAEKEPVNCAPWVGLLLVLQFLHAYPVAGSQVAWGVFLAIPLLALGLHDTFRFLGARGRTAMVKTLGVACLAVAVFGTGRMALIGWERYAGSQPLGLPGAEDVRPPEDLASALRVLTLNARAHGDLLFSLPGLFSMNGWTGLPTPTLANTTHWFSLLNSAQQEEISGALGRSARPIVIVHRGLLDFLSDSHFVIASPLNDYLNREFTRAFTVGKYEFLVRRGRIIAALSTAELLQLQTGGTGLSPYKLDLVVMLPEASRVARIELARVDDPTRIVAHWDQASENLSVTPINLQGAAIGPRTDQAWHQPVSRLVRFELPLSNISGFDENADVVYVRDNAGAILAEARFVK